MGWKPREENEVADKVSNGIVQGFDPKLRKRFFIKDLKMLHKILTEGRSLHEEFNAGKARRKLLAKEEALQERRRSVREAEEKLRNRDPWA